MGNAAVSLADSGRDAIGARDRKMVVTAALHGLSAGPLIRAIEIDG